LRPSDRWPFWPGWLDLGWGAFSALNLAAIVVFERWETIPFHFIWISVTLLYGFRIWPAKPTLWVLAAVIVTTFLAIGLDVWRRTEPIDELNEVPLMAAMFWAMVWHARRRLAADMQRVAVSEQMARLLDTQRQFLQDASHQLRTPITIALGHAELLARELVDLQERRDIGVVVGELIRLKGIGQRLLLIAAAENPDFLHPGPVAAGPFIREAFLRWQPTADRDWQLGRADDVTVSADRERLSLAVDALLENAVQHTRPGQLIRLSAGQDRAADQVCIVVEDGGHGIAATELASIFERFRTGSGAAAGTGLGLALVRSIAHAHGGEVRVHSVPGGGSRFVLMLPATAAASEGPGRTLASALAPQPGSGWTQP
jgi:signal transduction histidine kinase